MVERIPDMRFFEIAHSVLDTIFQDDEPMPPWSRGDIATLEMCCQSTEVECYGEQKYPDLPSKAAKLFYSCIKNHPFPNGNKRFALVVTLGFIALNDYRLTAADGVSHDVATWVADTDPHSPEGDPDGIVDALADFFREHIEPFDWSTFAETLAEEDADES